MDLQRIHDEQERYYNATLAAFEYHLREIIGRANVHVAEYLRKRLKVTDGIIDNTGSNARALRRLDRVFMKAMEREGYERLVSAFVGHFPQQLPFLQDTLAYLSSQLRTPLPPVEFSATDLKAFSNVSFNAAASIDAAIETGASAAMTQVLFSVGGLSFSKLTQLLMEKYETTVARAKTLADTAQATFYRTALDRAYQIIERDAPGIEQLYRYSGPEDPRNRPFCHRLLVKDAGYTRAQVNAMNNGQLPNVFYSAGGWNCRHQWILDTRPILARMKAAAA